MRGTLFTLALLLAPAALAVGSGVEFDRSVLDGLPDETAAALAAAPKDPRYGSQYGPASVKAPEAWERFSGDITKTVCVIDTGARTTHEDLESRIVGGKDFVNGDSDPSDDNGHGTHVAGIVGASRDNGRGIAGVAPAPMLIAKVLNERGGGRATDVAKAIRWCADSDAAVITMSLGFKKPVPEVESAVKYAHKKGALLIAAAGNDGPQRDSVGWPAAYPEVVAVTCTDAAGKSCDFSSTGVQADIAAPGHQILSTYHTGDAAYKALSGTSMSTPHVAGVAALVWSAAPKLTNEEVRGILETTARDAGRKGWDETFGHGVLDADAAVKAALEGKKPAPPEPKPLPGKEPAGGDEPADGKPPAKKKPKIVIPPEFFRPTQPRS